MKKEYEKGLVVTGFVTGIEDYGIFISLDKFNNGLIHISEVDNCYISNLNNYVEIGELIRVRVLGKVGDGIYKLSIKDLDYRITKHNNSKIKETPHGFINLALHLDYWINKKLKK